MKKIILLTLIVCLSLPLFAQQRVFDNAGLLSGNQVDITERMAREIADAHNFNLIIVTMTELEEARLFGYANEFFAKTIGEGKDGGILLQVTGSRDWVLSAYGRGTKIANSYAQKKLETVVVEHLSGEDYAGAYREFLNMWEKFLLIDSKGRVVNFYEEERKGLTVFVWIIAVVIGCLILTFWNAKMNTALPKTEANAFIVPGSLAFTRQQETFLNSVITKTRRESSSSTGGGTRSISGGRGSSRGKY